MAGRPDTEVAALAGHKDAGATGRIYAHWLNPDHDAQSLARLDDVAPDALVALAGAAANHRVDTDGNEIATAGGENR